MLTHRSTESRGCVILGCGGTVLAMARVPPPDPQAMKRLTLDLPAAVHRAFKVRCAELDVPMAELLRELLSDAMKKPSTLRDLAQRVRQ